jgi:YjbE family integral membrane protein
MEGKKMEIFSAEWFTALLGIIIIDLVLAGDNAVVIGLAARNVPKDKQRIVIIWGTVGAVVIRAISTLVVVWLLKIPGLLALGGLLLIWIAYKLLVDKKDHAIEAKNNFWSAMGTIIMADAVMGIDNVLAVAGAAHGDFLLVIIGLIISIPIVVWGSTLILKWLNRFPAIIYIGAGVLALTAAKMITVEPFLKPYFADPFVKWPFIAVIVAAVLLLGKKKNKTEQHRELAQQ